MKRIHLLFAISIIVILFFGLSNVNAVDSSKWKTITVDGTEFKIPPEYENGNFIGENKGYCKDSHFYFDMWSYKNDSHQEFHDFGYALTSNNLKNIQMDHIGNHDVIIMSRYYSHWDYADYYIEIWLMCGNVTYKITQNGTNMSENVKELIKTSPKQNLTSQEFYSKYYTYQIEYMKYLDDLEWVNNDIQQFENQKKLERQAQNDNMNWYLFGYLSNNY